MDRDIALLLLGVLAGVLLAAFSLIDVPVRSLPETVSATVNDKPISDAQLTNRQDRLAMQGASKLVVEQSLTQLIDEELLIQRGEELDLVRLDSNVRESLLAAMRNAIASEQQATEPSEEELRQYFSRQKDLFTTPSQFHIEHIQVRDVAEANQISEAFNYGASFDTLRTKIDQSNIRQLPPVPLSSEALKRFLPESVVTAVLQSTADRIGPIETDRGTYYLNIKQRLLPEQPVFEQVRTQVQNEFALEQEQAAYDTYLSWLRRRAEIRQQEEH